MLETSLRPERIDSSRLAWAFAISLALHVFVLGSYQAGRTFGWWQKMHLPAWMHSAKTVAAILKKESESEPPQEVPLLFVDVNPAQATPEPPNKAPYYSDKNSQAANPDPQVNSETPRINGQQIHEIKTEDVPRTKAFPLQPALPLQQAREAQEEIKPKATFVPGDLALGKPDPTPRKDEGQAPLPRPRTIKEAMARPQNSRLAGEKMKQAGGARRHDLVSSLAVEATAFGGYDALLIGAVKTRWLDLLESRDFARDRVGRVTVRFHLNSDGSISEISFVENTVDLALGLLCQSAIKDPSPFAPWPK